MKTNLTSKLFSISLTIIAACLMIAGQAKAQLIYDDGAASGTINAWNISPDWSVSDSFTVSSPTTLASAQAGLWVGSGTTLTNLQWSIGTTPFASDISFGNANM